MLTFEQARQASHRSTLKTPPPSRHHRTRLHAALGHILAQNITADRDYPPFDRSTRDGYAVRAAEATAGATLKCIGEIKAGDPLTTPLSPKTCIQIMTGAAVPQAPTP